MVLSLSATVPDRSTHRKQPICHSQVNEWFLPQAKLICHTHTCIHIHSFSITNVCLLQARGAHRQAELVYQRALDADPEHAGGPQMYVHVCCVCMYVCTYKLGIRTVFGRL